MEKAILPTGLAHEPSEGACLRAVENMSPHQDRPLSSRKLITFAEDTDLSEKSASQRSYKDVLSQPSEGLSHRQKMLWLQKRRSTGLWVQCDECDRWRYLPHLLDSTELPHRWYCRMNPDPSFANCSVSEAPIRPHEEEDLIHSLYSAGSLVWARLAGWPWWPAMVDDCPDTEQYYWLDGFSDIPTHYNVTFFDTKEVTRSWITPNNLKPFLLNKNLAQLTMTQNKYKSRLESASKQADNASKLPLLERLGKYSFIAKFTGSVNTPKSIPKNELIRHHKKMQRRFDIEFPIEVCESDDDCEPLQSTTTNKMRNMILLGTPKRDKVQRRTGTRDNVDNATDIQDTVGNNNNTEQAISPAFQNTKENINVVDLDANVATNVQYSNITNIDTTPALPAKRNKPKRRIQDSLNMINFNETATPLKHSADKIPETEIPVLPVKRDKPTVPKFAAKKEKGKRIQVITGVEIEKTVPSRITLGKAKGASGPSAKDNKPEPDSMAVQIGSTNDTVPATVTESYDDDTSKTYVPESGQTLNSTQSTADVGPFELRAGSPSSNDFDF